LFRHLLLQIGGANIENPPTSSRDFRRSQLAGAAGFGDQTFLGLGRTSQRLVGGCTSCPPTSQGRFIGSWR
jgi:hypothetical protein